MNTKYLGWLLSVLMLAAMIIIAVLIFNRLGGVERQMAAVARQVDQAVEKADRAEKSAQDAQHNATQAKQEAASAAQGRLRAEEAQRAAEETAEQALEDASQAQQERNQAVAEADKIRRERQQELQRLEKALGAIADTRRNALGLVMNLGEDALKFDFDKATLRPQNREILSRIAGVLLTSTDYTVYVYGHTDNVGSQSYNQRLSERRAETVRDYLVEAGVSPKIISTEGYGKSRPLVKGNSPQARAKNRRVEIGIVNTRIIGYQEVAQEER
ncbi:MAG TPA: OmpA family protein [Acidobacteriota bacterium]|nr:OmpA family protein [Acidobacteriota bacterium]